VSEEIDHLWALKGLDEEAAEARAALARYPEQKQQLESRAKDERKKLEDLQARIAEANRQRRQLERDAEAAGEQERKFSAQLPLVKKNEEYQALLHEIAACRQKRSEVETQVLMQMELEESLAREKPAVEKSLKAAEAELATRRGEIEGQERQAMARVQDIDRRREQQLEPLAAPARARYERVHHSRTGTAIVAIVKGACGGCFRAQPPQVLQEARRRDRLISCEGCGRLLIWPPEGA
jgi:predicted  nucleic acid-binding Zn-ribbon protein